MVYYLYKIVCLFDWSNNTHCLHTFLWHNCMEKPCIREGRDFYCEVLFFHQTRNNIEWFTWTKIFGMSDWRNLLSNHSHLSLIFLRIHSLEFNPQWNCESEWACKNIICTFQSYLMVYYLHEIVCQFDSILGVKNILCLHQSFF